MRRRLFHPIAVGLLLTAAVAGLAALGRLGKVQRGLEQVERLERLLLDARFQWRGKTAVGPEVAIVEIDDRSAREDQSLVERRSGAARIVRAAKAAGAKVIVLDILFFEPEQPIDPVLSRDVLAWLARCEEGCEQTEAAGLLKRLAPELTGDRDLADAIREAGNVVLALHAGRSRGGEGGKPKGLAKGRFGQTVLGPTPPAVVDEVMASLPLFNEQARALGFVTAVVDDTSTLREVGAAFSLAGNAYAALAVQATAVFLGVPRSQLTYDGEHRWLVLGERSVPFDPSGGFFLNLRGPPEATFPRYAAVDLVREKLPAGALEGRIVMVGYTHLGHDRARTSFGDQVPGIEINATLVDNLLRGDPLRRAPWWWDVLACLALGVAVTLLFWPRLLPGVLWQVVGSLGVLGLCSGASYWAFVKSDLWLAWAWPAIGFITVLLGCLSASYAREGLQRRELRRAFSHYLAEEVIHDLERRDEPLALGGERRVLTALFSDIRGFTTLSERLDPLQVVNLLNTHLSAMTEEVLERGGLLDKYIGDALMAFFGAPVPHADHVDRALAATLAMHRALEGLNEGPFQALGLKVAIGVGLNTGEMVVGNMGSPKRFNYTIAGDAVNLASRLEGLTKTYGVFCLVGDGTRKAAGREFVFREVDLVQVKGKTEAIAIHQLVGGPGRTLASYAALATFAQGMAAWRAGSFPEARSAFEEFRRQNPEDRVVQLYLERIEKLGERAPEGWSGVFVHTSK